MKAMVTMRISIVCSEAKKVLAEELSATLLTIAKDVKIQVEFNPARFGIPPDWL